MTRKTQDSVVVITGASSGIGRAAALAFARAGAAVVLAARREQALHQLAEACRQLDGRALVVPIDVADQHAAEHLAARTIEHFGRLNVWVNNAAVTLFSRFEEAPVEAVRRVIETNLMGYIHGARAALRRFCEQGSGVLINNASVVASVPQPYTSAYTISKHGIRALGMSVRQELLLEGAKRIHVCTVLPATIDTPLFQHAANYTGRAVKAMPPVMSPERVAAAMVRLVQKPRREVFVGHAGRMLTLTRALAPGFAEKMMARQVDRQHFFQDRAAPPSAGNLFEPMPQLTDVRGGWKSVESEQRMPAMAMAGVAAVAVAGLAWLWLRGRRAPAPPRQLHALLR